MWWRKLNLLISKQGVLSPTLFAGFGALQLTLMEVWLICHNELHLVLFALFLPSPVTGVPILALGNDVGGGAVFHYGGNHTGLSCPNWKQATEQPQANGDKRQHP